MRLKMTRLLCCCVAAAALIAGPSAHAASPTGWAILFAPGKFAGEALQKHQPHAVERIADQLANAGWPREQLRTLSGEQATLEGLRAAVEEAADTMSSDDVLLVVLATKATSDKEIRLWGIESKSAADSQLPLEELLKTMATAPTQKRVLLADFTLDKKSADAPPADYASLPLAIGAGQFVVINAAEVLEKREGQSVASSPFIHAVVDALAGLAAAKNQEQVSLFATLEYLRLYLQAKDLAPPVIQGSTSSDYMLAAVNPDLRPSYSPEQRKARSELAQALLASAERAFLIERQETLPHQLLERARQYAEDEQLARRMLVLKYCMLAFDGGADRISVVWKRAEESGVPLYLLLDDHRYTGAYQVVEVEEGKNENRLIPNGMWLKVEKLQDGKLWVTGTFKQAIADGKVSFEVVSTDSGWVSLDAFPRRSARTRQGFDQRLRLLNAAE